VVYRTNRQDVDARCRKARLEGNLCGAMPSLLVANNLIGGIQAEIGSRAVEADINTVSGLLRLRQREGVILSILLKARVNAA